MKFKTILAAALSLCTIAASAQKPSRGPEYEFKTIKENPVTSVKNQFRSGT